MSKKREVGPGRVGRRALRMVWGVDADFLIADLEEVARARAEEQGSGPRLRTWMAWQVTRSIVRGIFSVREPMSRSLDTTPPGPVARLYPRVALRLAARGLRRDIRTSVAITAILALGIAAPAVFFSLMWGGGMRSLPVPDGHRIVRIEVTSPVTGDLIRPEVADVEALAATPSLEAVGGWAQRDLTLRGEGWGAIRVAGAAITGTGLRLLNVPPAIGRLPDASGERDGILLSWSTWQELFAGDPGVVGQDVTVNGIPSMITGIMPRGFRFPLNHSAWVILDPVERGAPVAVFARLAEGVGIERAVAELTIRWRRLDDLRREDRTDGVVSVQGYTRGRGEGGEARLFFGLVVVGVALLLIATVNASNLLMVRAVERVDLLGIQASLGAGSGQIALQLMLEALLLSLGGGIGGLLLTHLVIEYIQASSSANFGYYWMRMQVEGPVVLFVGALVMGTALVAGSLPVRRVLKVDLQQVLKGRGAGGLREKGIVGRFVTGAQLSLSCAALVAAGLASRAIDTASDFGGTLPSEEVLVATLDLPDPLIGSAGEQDDVRVRLLSELSGSTGNTIVAIASGAPGYLERPSSVTLPGRETSAPPGSVTLFSAVTPEFFDAFELDPEDGRVLATTDDAGSPRVAVVNRAWVQRWLSGEDAVGARVTLPQADSVTMWEVVGVVETLAMGLGERANEDRIYLPAAQLPGTPLRVVARRAEDPLAMVPDLRRRLSAVHPDLALSDPMTLAQAHDYMTRAQRTLSLLAAGGGYASLLVAAVGLYGLLAFRVRRRRFEHGVRLAMGASGARLGLEVLAYALRQIAPAMAAGLGLAWLAAPGLSGLLLGHDVRALSSFAAVGTLFLVVGVLSAIGPALTASRVEPAQILRSD